MVTSINLGSTFQSGDRTVFGGGSSGLDTEGVIEGLMEARQIPITRIETRIEENQTTIDAYVELQSIIDTFRNAADLLRAAPGFQNEDDNVFNYKNVALSSSDGTAASNYISVTAAPGANDANFELEVTQLAQRQISNSDTIFVADASTSVVEVASTANRFTAGVMEINNGETITLDVGDTLTNIVNKINAISDASGVSATLVQVNSGEYVIQTRSVDTGAAGAFDLLSVANTAPGGPLENISFATPQNAQDAILTLDGLTVQRSSNVIDDAIDDVTFTLLQETPALTTIDASIEADTELIRSGIINLVDAYNELRVFNARQNERDAAGDLLETAVLGSDTTLRTVLARVDAEVTAIVGNISGGDPSRLADIGIEFVDIDETADTPATRNIMQVDEAVLNAALADDPEAVANLFEFNMTTDNENLVVYERTNALSVYEFDLTIDVAGQTAQATYDPGSGPITVNFDFSDSSGSIVLTGQDGTVFEGLELIYADTVNDTISVSITHGIGDRLFNTLDELGNADEGMVKNAVTSLVNTNEELSEEITGLEAALETYRQSLIERFSSLEAAIAQVNSLLQLLAAQADARNNSS